MYHLGYIRRQHFQLIFLMTDFMSNFSEPMFLFCNKLNHIYATCTAENFKGLSAKSSECFMHLKYIDQTNVVK